MIHAALETTGGPGDEGEDAHGDDGGPAVQQKRAPPSNFSSAPV